MQIRFINELLDMGAEMILCTGGMSVDPDDRTPYAICQVSDRVVTYGAPVLPGAMFMLAYKGDVPVVDLPGCVMHSRRTVFDLILPRLMAKDTITHEEIRRKILFTIVSKKGAAPHEAGTKMLYTSEGKSIGTIGGGCTEAEVIRRANEMFIEDSPSPVLVHVNLSADEAALEGEVCGGLIDVWLEMI